MRALQHGNAGVGRLGSLLHFTQAQNHLQARLVVCLVCLLRFVPPLAFPGVRSCASGCSFRASIRYNSFTREPLGGSGGGRRRIDRRLHFGRRGKPEERLESWQRPSNRPVSGLPRPLLRDFPKLPKAGLDRPRPGNPPPGTFPRRACDAASPAVSLSRPTHSMKETRSTSSNKLTSSARLRPKSTTRLTSVRRCGATCREGGAVLGLEPVDLLSAPVRAWLSPGHTPAAPPSPDSSPVALNKLPVV